ncbi:MAG TPA: MOSC N-terminal beta barrel domain-containing protein [Burkholderiaceae bacterium]|jgi:hypothetical protein
MRETLRVRADSLYLYPIKACAAMRVACLRFTQSGTINGDREWVITDAAGNVTWQGSHPRLALVQPRIRDERLHVSAPGLPSLDLPSVGDAGHRDIQIWNDGLQAMETFSGYDAGPDAAALLRLVTGADLRLVRLAPPALARASLNPAHLVSTASLAELNDALAGANHKAAEAVRFRPNIVLSASESPMIPFLEEQFNALSWRHDESDHRLALTGHCIRCIVPNVDPVTATVSEAPLAAVTAQSAQRYPSKPAYFGMYARASSGAVLLEGQVLEATLTF